MNKSKRFIIKIYSFSFHGFFDNFDNKKINFDCFQRYEIHSSKFFLNKKTHDLNALNAFLLFYSLGL